ncbi:FAD-binding oxidoreductase [Paraburkholderia sp. J41]|uniref:FAD-binding oxidoreductase n=1 Tax=Paraburkholderia sp. J41 TaxID=2805433 RepID=UPI002AC36904|nr:FAD-binding oxidoreductase [Paraburkholderia sp. J41]
MNNAEYATQTIKAKAVALCVRSLTFLSSDVVELVLMPASPEQIVYREGQFLSIRLPDGATRSYSMARGSRPDGQIVLHIKLRAGGHFSEMLRGGHVSPGDTLTALGPFGDCVWHDADATDRVLMLATGTGIAPLHAMLDSLCQRGDPLPEIHLYWGGVDAQDLYLHRWFDALAAIEPSFHYTPVYAGPLEARVQHVAAGSHRMTSRTRIYACGAPAMVSEARELFVSHGLPPERFHCDAFEPALAAQMPTTKHVTVHARGVDGACHTLSLAEGTTLMTALSARSLMLGVCRGQCACGTCRIRVDAGSFERLPGASRQEKRLLAVLDDPDTHHRLACQITLCQDLNDITFDLPPPIDSA